MTDRRAYKGPPDWRNHQLVDAIREMLGMHPLYARKGVTFCDWLPRFGRREMVGRRTRGA